MSDPAPLLCAYVVEGEPPSHPAVVRTVCRPCGVSVWVTIVMLPKVHAEVVKPVCVRCARGLLDKPGARAALPREVAAELRALGVLNGSRSVVAEINREARERRRQKAKARKRKGK